jgi:putative endonuclease
VARTRGPGESAGKSEREREHAPCFADLVPRDGRQALGKQGEDLACAELARRGYVIVARRFRTRAGEIDIVARDGGVLVFVEVKTRRSIAFGTPLEAVTVAKQRTVCAMAAEYLARCSPRCAACRFDVVSVRLDGGAAQVEIVQSAFDLRR